VAFGIFSTSLGPSFGLVLVFWCLGSLFAGFIYNTAVTTANKWFPDKRGLTAGLIAGAFTWGALPFIFPIRAIPKSSPPAVFFHVIYTMAAIIGGVAIICALFMKDPPGAWKPRGWVPKTAGAKRPSEHEYNLGEALQTWQMWVLVVVMFLVTATGLTGVSKAVQYSHSFGFTAAAATAAAGGLAIAGGGGRPMMGWLSEYIGREVALILSCFLCSLCAFLMLIGGAVHGQGLFLIGVIGIVCFWGATFGLFPTIVGHYYGSVASGSNYGILYAIAKGLAGVFGGVISAVLISTLGLTFTILVSGFMALFAGLICIPLKFHPPVWTEAPATIPDQSLTR
jgi:OFA family oxalate/formate antiporter-like MFS transporter